MSIRLLLWTIRLIGVVSLVSAGAILIFLSPREAGTFGLTMLTVSVALFLTSVLTFLGLRLRKKFISDQNRYAIVTIALREAGMASVVLLMYLWLGHFDSLSIWVVPLALIAAAALEYYFLTHSRNG